MSQLKRIQRILNTVRHLKIRQFIYFLRVRTFGQAKVAMPTNFQAVSRGILVGEGLPVEAAHAQSFDFSFLSVNKVFADGDIDWASEEMTELWRFNLHYFDYLQQHDRPDSEKRAIINHWIDNNFQGMEPAWDPYTTSLRIVNWCKWFSRDRRLGQQLPAAWLNSLFEQGMWLEKNFEKELLANHYFENLKAMLFVASFLQGKEPDRWLVEVQQLMADELDEQILPDGGHYERAPQYHCVILIGLLDMAALIAADDKLFDKSFVKLLKLKSQLMVDWLATLLSPKQQYPLFNDSAYSAATVPEKIFNYARSLGFNVPDTASTKLIQLPETGLYGWRSCRDYFVIDCGDIGPDYQPGHTQCDFHSYELIMSGNPIVTDTGVYEYAPGVLRSYVRSTAAHNTVMIDNSEQSEVWAQFRVARRAKKVAADILQESDNRIQYNGEMKGFFQVNGGAVHNRQATVTLDQAHENILELEVSDTIEAKGSHQLESYIHLHPAVEVVDKMNNTLDLLIDGKSIARVIIGVCDSYTVGTSLYAPVFGEMMERSKIVIVLSSKLPVTFGYKIQSVLL